MKLKIRPPVVLKVLLLIIVILLLGNIIGLLLKFNFSNLDQRYLDFFDFNQESNFPSFYSALALIIVAFLLLFITYIRKGENLSYGLWFILAIAFFFLAIDESIEIHERIGNLLRKEANLNGVFYYAWVIPYGIFLLLFAIIYYFKFLRYLPIKIRKMIFLSGAIYVFGALGLEMLGSILVTSTNQSQLLIAVVYSAEELFEMLGIALFIYTLLLYIKEELGVIIKSKKNSLKK